ncbi:MAG: TonB-dependent siderophore receptor [Pseudomonas sp.]
MTLDARVSAVMGGNPQPATHRTLLLSAAIASALLNSAPALAQDAGAPAGQVLIAQADQAQDFSIAAQPLGSALNRFSEQTGIAFAYTSSELEGIQSPGVSGRLAPHQALEKLLAGTGISYQFSGNDTVVLSRVDQAGALELAPVTVSASGLGAMTEGTGSYTTGETNAATGMNLSLRETPQSVTVITSQRMDDQALDSLADVLAQAPGVSVSGSSSQASGALTPAYSRGYLLNRFQVDGAMASPGTFSGAGLGWYGLGGLQTVLYDSVTVVRGPTGLLSGTGDPSGSINLVRKRPTDTFQGALTGSMGRWDQYQTTADVGGPLNEAGTLRGRLVASYDEAESWVERYQQERRVVYAVLDADLGDATVLSLALESHDGHFDGAGGGGGMMVAFNDNGTATPFSRSDNPNTDWSYSDEKKNVASLALEQRFNDDWDARLRYSYTSLEVDAKYGDIRGVNSDGSIPRFNRYRAISPNETRSHDWDLRLNGGYTLLGRQHELVAGINGYNTRGTKHANSLRFWPSTANALGWDGDVPEPDWSSIPELKTSTETEQYGAFLSTRLRPTDDLSVIVGGRLSTWETRVVDKMTGDTTDDRRESSVFTPYAGIVYDLNAWLSAYASYTEIFNPQSAKDVSGSILDPEEGKNYELGLKGEWFDGRLNASLAAFETRKDNLAVRDGDRLTPEGGFAYVAASGTKGRGWELEVSGQLTPEWQLQAGYARIVTEDANGERLNSSYVPKHSVKLFSTWTPAQLSKLTVGGGVLWQSEINESSNSAYYSPPQLALFQQESYAVANLMAQYRFNDQLSLTANLNNLLDKDYRNITIAHEYGAARNLHATLKYQF